MSVDVVNKTLPAAAGTVDQAGPEAGAPRVSVIVPSYNSRHTIGLTLASLRAQTAGFPYEVIVVDSSGDGTDAWVAREFPEVRLVHLKGQTYQGKARNIGARMARAPLLAFLDADCQACPEWVARIAEDLGREGVGALGGPLRNANPGSPVSRAMFVLQFRETLSRSEWTALTNHPAANSAYRREVFEQVGGYPEEMGSSEETVMNARLAERGWPVYFSPAMPARHWNLDRLRHFLTHQIKQGCFYRQARLSTPLPGHRALDSLWLTPLFPLYRFCRCLPVLGREVPRPWPFLATCPPLFLGFVFYSAGEIKGHLTFRK